ncbi:MAG: hypothetical protein J0H78_08145 [Rhizobiales bacterium]|nr:hypothetical protein [Hyphomicrobiales bacterium]OJY41900.1 MAG: hypothetical protein BGP08_11175 [Rhizobiales bacterium 64-17]
MEIPDMYDTNVSTNSVSPKALAREQLLTQTLTALANAGIAVQVCSPHHIKYGALNYYPKRGIICRDGSNDILPERGLSAFITVCLKDTAHSEETMSAFQSRLKL